MVQYLQWIGSWNSHWRNSHPKDSLESDIYIFDILVVGFFLVRNLPGGMDSPEIATSSILIVMICDEWDVFFG